MGLRSKERVTDLRVANRFRWERTPPLGTPVLPLVYMMMAGVEGVGGTGATLGSEARRFPAVMTSQNGTI